MVLSEKHLRVAKQLTGLAIGCFGLIFLLFISTQSLVRNNERTYLRTSLSRVLPAGVSLDDFDNVVAESSISLDTRIVYPACVNSTLRYALLEISTDKGYSGTIRLLVNVDQQAQQLLAVRPLFHQETPGLGDQIEVEKSNWLTQFQLPLATPLQAVALRRDGGQIDSITGATITSRAVSQILATEVFSKPIPNNLCNQ